MTTSQSFQCLRLDASSLLDWLHLTSSLLRTYASAALASQGADDSHFLALALEGQAHERAALLLAELTDWSMNDQSTDQRLCILSVVVAKPFRHQGLARALLAHAEEWARAHQLSGLHLPVPLQANFTDALRRLSSTDHGWIATPGKVIVGLSISAAVEALFFALVTLVLHFLQSAVFAAPLPVDTLVQRQYQVVG